MTTQDKGEQYRSDKTTWGPVLFYLTLFCVIGFFWWLLIYPHGVAPH